MKRVLLSLTLLATLAMAIDEPIKKECEALYSQAIHLQSVVDSNSSVFLKRSLDKANEAFSKCQWKKKLSLNVQPCVMGGNGIFKPCQEDNLLADGKIKGRIYFA